MGIGADQLKLLEAAIKVFCGGIAGVLIVGTLFGGAVELIYKLPEGMSAAEVLPGPYWGPCILGLAFVLGCCVVGHFEIRKSKK